MRDLLLRLRCRVTPGTRERDDVLSGQDDLRSRWRRWEAMPYPTAQHPPGSDRGEVAGVDLALTDGDIAHVFDEYFSTGMVRELDRIRTAELASLERVVPLLVGPARLYFEESLALLQAIVHEMGEQGATDQGTLPHAR